MYEEIIKKRIFFIKCIFKVVFWNFKNSYIDNTKKSKPANLELGQIAKDLNVGDKNIDKDKITNKLFSTLLNFKTKHL